ncbi:MAG: hypothetical protein ABI442_16630 [Gemmatimonadaceae bacterium]
MSLFRSTLELGRAALRARSIVAALVVLVAGKNASAQLDPSHEWLTIETPHFYVHFTKPIEPLARRVAADAERAYSELSKELSPPRTKVDVVVSDDADYSNGYATPFPTNRIVVYANPPVSEPALRYTNDWAQLVITHELTHIFHLDRSRGIWAFGQKIFGRAGLLFPNSYSPSWLTEGLAVYEESKLTGAGRIQSSEHRMIARAAGLEGTFTSLGSLSLAQGRYPFGETAYAFGSLFVDYIGRTKGDSAIRKFVDKSSANLIPYLIDIPAKQAFGESFGAAWREFRDSVSRSVSGNASGRVDPVRQLTHDGVEVFYPRWLTDSTIVYSGTPGRETFGAFRVDLAGHRTRIGRRNSESPNTQIANAGLLYAQLDYTNPYQERSDLWVQRGRTETQLTFGQRLANPDVRRDGEIVAVQIVAGATRLVRVSANGKRVTPITAGNYDEMWTEPRWSHAGDRIAAVRWLRGNVSQIVILDTLGGHLSVIGGETVIQATPSWAPGDSGIYYRSDVTGSAQIYYFPFKSVALASGGTGGHFALSSALTGRFDPEPSPAGDHLASILFRSDGYHLGVSQCCDFNTNAWIPISPPRFFTVASPSVASVLVDSSPAKPFSPWRTLAPRYWLPIADQGIDGGYRIGASTSGYDVIGRHSFSARFEVPTNNTGVTGGFSYQYAGLGVPVLQADFSQDWQSLGGIFSRSAARQLIGEVFRRTDNADLLATWTRQRVRTVFSLTGGTGLEYRTHSATPSDDLLSSIDTTGIYGRIAYPSLIGAAGFANYQRPPFSISPEDGVQFNVTVRDRTKSGGNGTGGESVSAVSAASVYKSLNLPGFAHHVIALRGAAGYADDRAAGFFGVGGVSGTPFEIVPGYVIGEGRQTFPVRGFDPNTLVGIRAFTGTAEYRLPLYLAGKAPADLPFFLDRSFLTLFGDYGAAWCPTIATGREVCNRTSEATRTDIASVGAELNVNLGVLSWDSPYRFRLGYVHPTLNGALFGRRAGQLYVVSGVSF